MIVFFLTGLEIIGVAALFKAVAIGAALSAANYALQRALTPKPKPLERGKLQGESQIQDSRYGQMIPEISGGINEQGYQTGGVRTAGNIIWASEIRKIVTSEEVGGKGAPKQEVKTTTYYQDLAIAWGRGRLRLFKLWAGSKLVYDANGTITGIYDDTVPPDGSFVFDLPPDPNQEYLNPRERYNKVFNFGPFSTYSLTTVNSGTLRHYEGVSDQPVDSLIQADIDGKYGANSTPAYRGTSYTVIENLNLSEFGGFLPNFTALLVNLDTQSLTHLTTNYATRVGLLNSDLSLSAASGVNLRGVNVSAVQSPRATLEVLSRIYNFEFTEQNGKFTAVERGTKAAIVIPATKLGARAGRLAAEADPPSLLEIRLKDDPQIPIQTRVTFADPARDFQANTQDSPLRESLRSSRVDNLEYNVTLTADEARLIALRELYLAEVERIGYSFTLPYEYAYLAPTDVVTITHNGRDHRIRLLQITGGAPGVIECLGVQDEPEANSQRVTGSSGQGQGTSTVAVPTSSVLQLIDVALLRDTDDTAGVYAGLAPLDAGNGSWGGGVLFRDRGNGYEQIEAFGVAATMGRAITMLHSVSDFTVWDTQSFVELDLYAGILENKTELQVLNGANALLVGNEIIQFTTAVQINGYSRRWRVSNLLRGRRGTDWAGATHDVGERVVLLNDALKFLTLDISERTQARNWKAVTAGQNIADVSVWAFTYDANNLKPLSPVNVQGARDGSNNLTIIWQRRTRIGGQWLDSSDVPLGEESERYEVDIMSGVTVKRTISVTAQTASYTAAEQTSDGFTPGNAITVRVYQLSARVGRGFVREVII